MENEDGLFSARSYEDMQRHSARFSLLMLCGLGIAFLTFTGILLPKVLHMSAAAWVLFAASLAGQVACVTMLRYRQAYRLVMPSHFPTESGYGRIHKGAAAVQVLAFVAILLVAFFS